MDERVIEKLNDLEDRMQEMLDLCKRILDREEMKGFTTPFDNASMQRVARILRGEEI